MALVEKTVDQFGFEKQSCQNMRIKLSSCNQEALEKAVEDVVAALSQIGGPSSVSGPIPLPNRAMSVVVNRGPHIDGHSKEKFQTVKHCRVVEWFDATPLTHDVIRNLTISSGVGVEIKIISQKKRR